MSHSTLAHILSRYRLAAAASAGLVASALVLGRSQAAFTAEASSAPSRGVELVVSDGDRPLFDGRPMEVGDVRQACAEVTYRGDRPDVEVRLTASVRDEGLASLLQVTVEEGAGGAQGRCLGFVPAVETFRGSLLDFGQAEVGAWLAQPGDSRGYRFTTRLADPMPGAAASADVHWTATDR